MVKLKKYQSGWITLETTKVNETANDYHYEATTTTFSLYAITLGKLCTADWQCTAWSTCQNGQQTRKCGDVNECGSDAGKPAEQQSCSAPVPEITGVAVQYDKGPISEIWKILFVVAIFVATTIIAVMHHERKKKHLKIWQ